jgi:hypothetical protein
VGDNNQPVGYTGNMPAQNSTETAPRVVGRPFPKGVSGNPGGRPKGLVRLICEQTDDGLEVAEFMLGVLRDGNAARRDRIEAAKWLGRPWGRD